MPPSHPPLSTVLPPLICGTATFNNQYNPDTSKIPCNAIIQRALELGVTAFDTSPYYGPSESLLGTALTQPAVLSSFPRESYKILTKVGRIGASEFDYSPEWVRYSVQRSCERLHTKYLDVVYCHDVEFVTPSEVLQAVIELRRIRDTTGTIKYIGISGYPVPLLCELSELILSSTGEPLDVVMSYANYTLQNTTLQTQGLQKLKRAGVDCVPNASPLGMGLLRSVGVPVGGKGDFHPAPPELRQKVAEAAKYTASNGDKLETVAIRWALETWARSGSQNGVGVSVMGVSNLSELEETMSVYNSILDGLPVSGREVSTEKKVWSEERRKHIAELAEGVWAILGDLKDYTWASPDEGYINMRVAKGVVDVVAPLPTLPAPKGTETGLETDRIVKTSRL
ncbi:NAD(P)-linked oxidoreductase [Glarea lozoyensis ATCC 20868]|uniref:NAD(P)-linked oxidoreductase n=1 Tax=Glarea lozoyensis (strain ATCC 20868 / MF5171) TaxID=1116229 RepID=S3D1T6_GLAL2|nr:NAD(P)-linked oxidoreductase [Glarea lozoyensis ATCC 20868]EPE32522.1 NAD(P)-linked oxidoreductase [Glarea lozoyensis ATCC 20868]